MLRRLLLTLTGLAAVFWTSFGLAQKDIYVPESLKPWVDWVLDDNPFFACPVRATDGVPLNCIWVRETNIEVSRNSSFGATFELSVNAFAESTLKLPYSQSFKPQNVTLNGQEIALGGGNSAPEILVPVGSHSIRGELVWTKESEPRFLEIPRSGIVQLSIDGDEIAHPSIQSNGSRLWFSNEISDSTSGTTTPDTEVVRVFRHFTDDVPQTLTTYINVTVTGNPRTLEFGKVITDEYQITNLSSKWPAILSKDGNLVIQVSPGNNEINIDARAIEQLSSMRYHRASDIWPNLEYWGIQPRHDLRIIRMEGADRTDLSQVNAPRRMRDLTGFVLTADDELQLIEEQRGTVQPYRSTFDITRTIWLNFKGDSFTVLDDINSKIESAQRVNSSIPLGEVRVNGSSRLITYDESSEERMTSVYLKPDDTQLSSISRVTKSNPLSPNTWSVEGESLSARLHLPPGWMLLWSTGIDEVEGSWLSKWGIWDVFVVLLLLCLVWGLGGWKWTLVVAGTVVIGYQLDNAPTFGWVVLAGMCYALKAIRQVGLNQFATFSFWVIFAVVSFACVYHATMSMRNAIHPQLATDSPTFEQQIVNLLEQMGISDHGDYFRRIPKRYESIPATYDSFFPGDELMEEVVATGSRISDSQARAMISSQTSDLNLRLKQSEAPVPPTRRYEFDPTLPIAIQTGPGRPNWQWQIVSLGWNGRVAQDRKMDLVLLAPWMTRLMYALSAFATLLVLAYFLHLKAPSVKNCVKSLFPKTIGVTSLFLLGILFVQQDTQAEIPDADLLQELEDRLLALPDCLNNCAYLEETKVSLSDTVLLIEMQIHAEDEVAIPLPGANSTWNLVDVRQGSEQLPLLRERSKLYTLLDEGVHDIVLTANVDGVNQFDVVFELIPGHLITDAPNWQIEGLVRGQVGDRKLTFYREDSEQIVSTSQVSTTFAPLEVTPYVSVRRQLTLSYEPTLITSVSRVAPSAGEITVRIPLLANERVASSGMSVEDDHMVVTIKDRQQTVSWESKLEEYSSITLSAPSIGERTERWSIIGSDFWSYNYEGVVPIDVKDNQTMFVPRSNEVLNIDIQQTQPVPGESMTIGSVDYFHKVDPQFTSSYLELTILASQPGDIEITLPDEASVESLMFDDALQSIPTGNVVLLPVQSGQHQYALDWKINRGVSFAYSPHSAAFSLPAVNVRTTIDFPENRWVVWLAGSSLGSTVAFWSVLLGVVFAAVVISRVPNFPLLTRDAIILVAGASLVDLNLLVVVGIWFVAIWLKSHCSETINRPWLYRLGQLVLCGATLFVIYIVVTTIVVALTSDPNMYIVGSSYHSNFVFTWFSDEIAGATPSSWILSVPLWIYFVLILAWVMWLVFNFLQWMRTWWASLKTPVLWVPINYSGVFSKLKLGRK